MPTMTSVVIWIGVLFDENGKFRDFLNCLPCEVSEKIYARQWYEIKELTFREFEILREEPMGFGVEYHRLWWSDGIASFEDLLDQKDKIAQMKVKVGEIMRQWGVKKKISIYYQVDPD